jgi:hypothetical protein
MELPCHWEDLMCWRPATLVLVLVMTLVLISASIYPLRGEEVNPAAEGFRADASDARAIEIADEVMDAMGGRAAYDRTRFLRWNFFGRRTHLWDKWTGDLRTEYLGRDGRRVLICMNVASLKGWVWVAGEAVTDSVQHREWMERGKSIWINDSYWLVMPYKLKDTGVALRYGGESTMEDGRRADKLVLTFEGVGDTPNNKYDVYVARDTRLVEEWSFYENAADSEPSFRLPWRDWQPYGDILLSGDRRDYQLTELAVFDHVDPALFKEP